MKAYGDELKEGFRLHLVSWFCATVAEYVGIAGEGSKSGSCLPLRGASSA